MNKACNDPIQKVPDKLIENERFPIGHIIFIRCFVKGLLQ